MNANTRVETFKGNQKLEHGKCKSCGMPVSLQEPISELSSLVHDDDIEHMAILSSN